MTVPDIFALGGYADPLISLATERGRIKGFADTCGIDEDDLVYTEAIEKFWGIDRQIATLVPVSIEGAVELVRLIQERMQVLEWSEFDDQDAENLVVGLTRMGAVS